MGGAVDTLERSFNVNKKVSKLDSSIRKNKNNGARGDI